MKMLSVLFMSVLLSSLVDACLAVGENNSKTMKFEDVFSERKRKVIDDDKVKIGLTVVVISTPEPYKLKQLGIDQSRLIYHTGYDKLNDIAHVKQPGGVFCSKNDDGMSYQLTIVHYDDVSLSSNRIKADRKKKNVDRNVVESVAEFNDLDRSDAALINARLMNGYDEQDFDFDIKLFSADTKSKDVISMRYKYLPLGNEKKTGAFEGMLTMKKERQYELYGYSDLKVGSTQEDNVMQLANGKDSQETLRDGWFVSFSEAECFDDEISKNKLTVFTMKDVLLAYSVNGRLVCYKQKIPFKKGSDLFSDRGCQKFCVEKFPNTRIVLTPKEQLFFAFSLILYQGKLDDLIMAYQSDLKEITLYSLTKGGYHYRHENSFEGGLNVNDDLGVWNIFVTALWDRVVGVKLKQCVNYFLDEMKERGGSTSVISDDRMLVDNKNDELNTKVLQKRKLFTNQEKISDTKKPRVFNKGSKLKVAIVAPVSMHTGKINLMQSNEFSLSGGSCVKEIIDGLIKKSERVQDDLDKVKMDLANEYVELESIKQKYHAEEEELKRKIKEKDDLNRNISDKNNRLINEMNWCSEREKQWAETLKQVNADMQLLKEVEEKNTDVIVRLRNEIKELKLNKEKNDMQLLLYTTGTEQLKEDLQQEIREKCELKCQLSLLLKQSDGGSVEQSPIRSSVPELNTPDFKFNSFDFD